MSRKDYVVLGGNAGMKASKAMTLGVILLSEQTWIALLKTEGKDEEEESQEVSCLSSDERSRDALRRLQGKAQHQSLAFKQFKQ